MKGMFEKLSKTMMHIQYELFSNQGSCEKNRARIACETQQTSSNRMCEFFQKKDCDNNGSLEAHMILTEFCILFPGTACSRKSDSSYTNQRSNRKGGVSTRKKSPNDDVSRTLARGQKRGMSGIRLRVQ